MKNKDKTLNLEASQAIASLGIECGSEKWHAEYRHAHNQPKWKWVITDDLYEGDYWYYRNEISAPNLQELLALLPAIGEKLNWDKEPKLCYPFEFTYGHHRGVHYEEGTDIQWHAHNLLDTFTANYDMRDVSAEIIRLIKEK